MVLRDKAMFLFCIAKCIDPVFFAILINFVGFLIDSALLW